MKQFLRFQKAKDGTYLGVIQPDHNVLPLIIDHFKDRFNDQSFLIFDARRRYGFYYDKEDVNRITFCDDQALPFDFTTGKRVYLGNKVKLGEDEVIVIEGIHGL